MDNLIKCIKGGQQEIGAQVCKFIAWVSSIAAGYLKLFALATLGITWK